MSIEVNKKTEALRELDGAGSCVIAASAGTGKTHTLERIVADKVISGEVSIDEILVVTFTRRATAEMKGRIRTMLESILGKVRRGDSDGDVGGDTWTIGDREVRRIEEALNDFDEATISTIHGFCQELISDHAFSSGQLFSAELVDTSELFEDCFYDVLRQELAADSEYRPWLEAALEKGIELDDLVGQLQTILTRDATVLPSLEDEPFGGVSPGELEEKSEIATGCWQLFDDAIRRRIERRKAEEGLMTYDDLLETVRDGVRDGRLDEVLKERYQVVLVDEFQDTDPVQWEIFEEVFLKDDDRELYVIGDEKQAIYAFRGADLGTYREAIGCDGFADESTDLDTNYRSTEALIDAYNELFEKGFFGEESQTDYEPVDAPEGVVERQLCGEMGDEPIEVMHLDSRGEEINKGDCQSAFIARTADRIEKLIGDDTYTFKPDGEDQERPLMPGDIYVLTRTNYEADKVGEALEKRGVDYAFYRKPGLFETDEALDVIRLLRGISRPSDRSVRRKAMLTPFFAIRLDEVLNYDQGDDEGDWTPRKQLESWNQLAERREFSGLFDAVMHDSGVVRRELLSNDSERRLTNYHHIFGWLLGKAAEGHLGMEQLADLLQRHRDGNTAESKVEEETDLQRLETDRSAVQIMTIHKSKGLSAEVVFVCGGFGKRSDKNSKHKVRVFTTKGGSDKARATVGYHYKSSDIDFAGERLQSKFSEYVEAETERLFYVAITRAKSKLYLPYFDKNFETGKWWPKSSIKTVFRALEDVSDGPIESLESKPGFEVDSFTPSDVDTELLPPRIVDADDVADVLGGFDDSSRLAELARARRPEGPTQDATFDDLRAERRRITTSYTGMSGDKSGERGEAVELKGDKPLPKSINAGTALHQILEFLDYQTVAGRDNWKLWFHEHPSAQDLIEEKLEDNGFDPVEYGEYTARVVYNAFRAALHTGEEELPHLATVAEDRMAREVSFLLPIPQGNSESLGLSSMASGTVENGYFTGEIDVVFEGDDGRFYVADWKSDTRIGGSDYDFQTLSEHVENNYRKQVAVYTTALMRMLGIESATEYDDKFGGFFYLFVRGMNVEGDKGQFFERLDWADVQRLGEKFARFGNRPGEAIGAWTAEKGSEQ